MAKVEIVTDDMRAACLEAREEIIRLTEELRRRNVEQLRLRLALSVAFPVLKEYAPHLATLIYAAVEDPTIRCPTLILSNDWIREGGD